MITCYYFQNPLFEFHLFTTEISSKTDTWTEIADEEKNPHFEEWNTENKCQIKFGYFIKKSHVKKWLRRNALHLIMQ